MSLFSDYLALTRIRTPKTAECREQLEQQRHSGGKQFDVPYKAG